MHCCICTKFYMTKMSLNKTLRFILLSISICLKTTICIPVENLYFGNGNKASDFGPKYPITASYFKDRFTVKEWDAALDKFSSIGGDTVVTRAPELTPRNASDIVADPIFKGCSYADNSKAATAHCVSHAKYDMVRLGLNLKTFATYTNEENYSENFLKCPLYDKKIGGTGSGTTYYRLVFPLTATRDPCHIEKNSDVLVVFTSFSGTDPHELLLKSAAKRKMSVYFGLPSMPAVNSALKPPIDYRVLGNDLTQAYYQFVTRILDEHSHKYGFAENTRQKHTIGTNRFGKAFQITNNNIKKMNMDRNNETINRRNHSDTLVGYYENDRACLGLLAFVYQFSYPQVYAELGKLVKFYGRKFMIAPYIDLNKFTTNYSLTDHVRGFENMIDTGVVDIIAVGEGRGKGSGCYYFETEIDEEIGKVDPGLLKVLQHLYPNISSSVTYRQQYLGSNNQLFQMLSDARDNRSAAGAKFEFWLDIDAYEATNDNPCLPVDHRGSGMPKAIDRTTKSRLDWALSTAGLYVNKAMAFAWDPDFTCEPEGYNSSLADDILQDYNRPIVVYCGWHSKQNMSLVVIGHALLASITQSFDVQYQTREGQTNTANVYAYYVEGAWGPEHNRLPSLIYNQMFDLANPNDVAMQGTVTIQARGSYHACTFTYDYQ